MLMLSFSRLRGVRHPIPALELLIFLQPVAFGLIATYLWSNLENRALDEALFSFGRYFGYAELQVGKLFFHAPVINLLCRLAYLSLLAVIPIVYLARPDSIERRRFAIAVILVDVLILLFFAICPGAGPLYLLHADFPWRLPDLSHPHLRSLPGVPMNAKPSGHVTWVILMFWFARRHCRSGISAAAWIYMALTCLATLGMGEHYVIDLIVAVPFARGIWALVHRQWRIATVCMFVVTLWLVGIQRGLLIAVPPVLAWLLTGMTVRAFAIEGAGAGPVEAESCFQRELSTRAVSVM